MDKGEENKMKIPKKIAAMLTVTMIAGSSTAGMLVHKLWQQI